MPRKVKLKEPKYTITELFKEIKRACELRCKKNECKSCPLRVLNNTNCLLVVAVPMNWDFRFLIPRINKLLTGDLPF